MVTQPVTFLLTSVGRRVELVRHFQEYVERNPGRLRLLATEIDAHAPAVQALGEGIHIVPRTDDPAYVPTIASLCESEGIDAVFPLIDPDVSVLGDAGLNIPLASVGPKQAGIVSDKWLTYLWLCEHDIPTARTWVLGEQDGPGLDQLPLFMKPRYGSGGVDAFAARSAEALNFFSGHIEDPVIQELLVGPEVTIDVIVGRGGEVLATSQRKRLAVRGGEVSRGEVIDDPEITELVTRVTAALRPSGPVTVQGMYDASGRFRVTEVNARMGGGLPLSIAAGVPVAELLVHSHSGAESQPSEPLAVGLRMVRYDESFFYRP